MKKWDPNWTAENLLGVYSSWASYDNYWAGAKKACDDIGMSLPDGPKLESLAKKTTAEKEQLGLPTDGWFWSSSAEFYAQYALGVYFGNGRTSYLSKLSSNYKVLCVGD